jgi:hypothetical protein
MFYFLKGWKMTKNFVNFSAWRARIIMVGTIASLVLTTMSVASAEAPSKEEQSCHDFVQTFYDWYAKMARQEHKEASDTLALKQKPASFSPELTRRLKEDAAASAKVSGEIVGLDFDPFLNAQDFAEKYTVAKVTKKGANYMAEVYGTWNGKKGVKPDVTPELTNQSGRWIFENFHYQHTDIPANENLLSVLSVLKKDREKPAH